MPFAALVISRWAGHIARCSAQWYFRAGAGEVEHDARAGSRGLWADKALVSPWELRTSEKGRKGEPMGTR